MTLLSFPLVLHERTEESRRAAMKYLGYSLFGAALALFGFFVVAKSTSGAAFTPGGALTGPVTPLLLAAALAMIVGFGGKAGMIPLHDWLPTAHPEAPAPASAVLSGVLTLLYRAFNRLALPLGELGEESASVWIFALLGGLSGLFTIKGGRFLGYAGKHREATPSVDFGQGEVAGEEDQGV